MNEEIKGNEGDWKELVLARLEIMPTDYKLSVGNQGTFTKSELMVSVQKGDSIGKQIVKMQADFMKALASGELTRTLSQNG